MVTTQPTSIDEAIITVGEVGRSQGGVLDPWRGRLTAQLPEGRIAAIDVARFVALLGMVVAHAGSSLDADGQPTWWSELTTGRASALFALLAGVSLALMSGRTTPLTGRAATRTYVGLAVRALVVFAIGLALAWHNASIMVILPVYAVLFWLVIPFLRFKASTLFALGGLWMVIGPVLLFWAGRAQLGFSTALGSLTAPDGSEAINPNLSLIGLVTDPWQAVLTIFFTGTYPAVVWFAYVLIGAGIGRCNLREWQPAALFTSTGAGLIAIAQGMAAFAPSRQDAVADLGAQMAQQATDGPLTAQQASAMVDSYTQLMYGNPWTLLNIEAHSGSIGDLVNTVGSALVTIGLCLLIVRGGFRIWQIACGAGAMTLTLYVVHIVLTNAPWGFIQAHPLRWNVAVIVLIGMAFGLLRRSGPLEKVVSLAASRVAALVPAQPTDSGASDRASTIH